MTDFGTDTYCLDSLMTGRMASDATLIGQRLYHALITPRGALLGGPDEESFGEDLEEMIQMINKDKNRQEKKLTDNSWLGQELVNNILEMSFNFKFIYLFL